MPTGTLKRIHPERRYSFIVPDDRGPDVFTHENMFADLDIRAGDRVSYEIEVGKRGKQARMVRRVGAQERAA